MENMSSLNPSNFRKEIFQHVDVFLQKPVVFMTSRRTEQSENLLKNSVKKLDFILILL